MGPFSAQHRQVSDLMPRCASQNALMSECWLKLSSTVEGGKWLQPRMQRGEDGFAGGGHSSPGEKRRWAALTCGLLLEKFVEEPASAYTINFDIQACRTSLSDQGFIRCLMVLLSYETNV